MGTRKKRKNLKLIIIAAIAMGVLGMGAVTAATYAPAATGAANFGGLGSAHEHAAFIIKLDGAIVNFAQDKYQVKSPYIHVENRVGNTLHKHASQVPVGEFLKSVGMNVMNGCFVLDDGRQYCDNDEKRLRFFVNGAPQPISSLMGYVIHDNDHFLVIYGDESDLELQQEIGRVRALQIQS